MTETQGRTSGFIMGIAVGMMLTGWVVICPAGETAMEFEGQPIEFTYDSWDIQDLGQPEEVQFVTGSPAVVTTTLKDSPVSLKAPSMEFKRQDGIITATGGVNIESGTFTLRADKGIFDLKKYIASFNGNVKWSRGEGQSKTSGSNRELILHFAQGGIKRIEAKQGQVKIVMDKGVDQMLPPMPNNEAKVPEVPRIERATAPLEK